jgi:ATP-binding cassette subfamily B protein
MFKKFPLYKQHDEKDCGPTCLRIICKYYGKDLSADYLLEQSQTNREGTSMLALSRAAEQIGFQATGVKLGFTDLIQANALPFIAFWQQKHYIVVYKITDRKVYVSDPALGLCQYSHSEFKQHWCSDAEGVVLILETTDRFYENKALFTPGKKQGLSFIFSYLKSYKKLLGQLVLGLLIGSLLQLAFPFLTQNIVDIGIRNQDIPFIYLILFSQLLVFLGKTTAEILRGYILLHLSSRINISLLSDFFVKLMKLPLGYFDRKMVGDIFQRIYDHQRVESFLTSGTLSFIFSFISLIVFSCVLCYYNPIIFFIFLAGSILFFVWVNLFMKKRARLDGQRFQHMKANQDKNFELIFGMQEIKLHNAEVKQRWQWEGIQSGLFKLNMQSLTLKQWQTVGASVLNELKNITVSFFAAKLVISGDISLGVMLSVSYIIGQLNSPLTQILDFTQSLQDARLSLERISEIHTKPEEDEGVSMQKTASLSGDIVFTDLSFSYDRFAPENYIVRNLNLVIPENKVTAIVGSSGSGKTTLLKLLLKFYQPTGGSISINDTPLSQIDSAAWRARCGVVMQEGYIFDDTILNNIAVGDENPDPARIIEAVRIANIQEHIESLPMSYMSKIGANGIALSTGQKQRILIARAVYKNPDILIFDEATSALDARNERIIVENLKNFYKGRTVIVIAHRLSTVRNADKIIVLEKGNVTETGTHTDLVTQKGLYFNLVKNQLELGS